MQDPNVLHGAVDGGNFRRHGQETLRWSSGAVPDSRGRMGPTRRNPATDRVSRQDWPGRPQHDWSQPCRRVAANSCLGFRASLAIMRLGANYLFRIGRKQFGVLITPERERPYNLKQQLPLLRQFYRLDVFDQVLRSGDTNQRSRQ